VATPSAVSLKAMPHRSQDTETVMQATAHPAGIDDPFGLASIGCRVEQKPYPPPTQSLADGIPLTASRRSYRASLKAIHDAIGGTVWWRWGWLPVQMLVLFYCVPVRTRPIGALDAIGDTGTAHAPFC
jgi:hypothetical protein